MTYGGFQSLDAMQRWKKFGSAPFAPTDLSNLLLWLDASDAATITHSSGDVSQWNDKSGNSYNFTASGSNRPKTGTRTLNSLNALESLGTNTGMTGGGTTLRDAIIDGTITVFIVYSNDTNTTARLLNVSNGADPNTRWGIASNGRFTSRYGANEITANAGVNDTNAHIGWFKSDGTTNTVDRDGASATTITPLTLPISKTQNTQIFREYNNINVLDGTIGEIIVYSDCKGSTDESTVLSYLSAKWGVTIP